MLSRAGILLQSFYGQCDTNNVDDRMNDSSNSNDNKNNGDMNNDNDIQPCHYKIWQTTKLLLFVK